MPQRFSLLLVGLLIPASMALADGKWTATGCGTMPTAQAIDSAYNRSLKDVNAVRGNSFERFKLMEYPELVLSGGRTLVNNFGK